MNIIRPTVVTDTLLFGSDVTEVDHAAWAIGTTYAAAQRCIVTTPNVHMIYESLAGGNFGHDPVVDCALAVPLYWKEISATNRWKAFDEKVGSQTTKATSMTYVFTPGIIDSIALLNLDSTEIKIIMMDTDTNLITNGTAWTGATGTTQPNSWDKVGTPSDFTIDSTAIKITADANGEGIKQTVVVVPGTEMQLLGTYKNTAGDIAQYKIYDETNAVDILATTDLASDTAYSVLSYVFTVPVGCVSLTVSLLAKTSGDIVWFDTIMLGETVYSETTNMISTVNVTDWYTYFFEPIIRAVDLVQSDLAEVNLPPYLTAKLTVVVTYAGGTALCGEIVFGLKSEIGILRPGPSVGITDYSTKTADENGYFTITERAYSKRFQGDLLIKNTLIDEIFRQLTLYRATPLVWVGSENYTCLIVYGFCKSFDFNVKYPKHTEFSLEVEGLT